MFILPPLQFNVLFQLKSGQYILNKNFVMNDYFIVFLLHLSNIRVYTSADTPKQTGALPAIWQASMPEQQDQSGL